MGRLLHLILMTLPWAGACVAPAAQAPVDKAVDPQEDWSPQERAEGSLLTVQASDRGVTFRSADALVLQTVVLDLDGSGSLSSGDEIRIGTRDTETVLSVIEDVSGEPGLDMSRVSEHASEEIRTAMRTVEAALGDGALHGPDYASASELAACLGRKHADLIAQIRDNSVDLGIFGIFLVAIPAFLLGSIGALSATTLAIGVGVLAAFGAFTVEGIIAEACADEVLLG